MAFDREADFEEALIELLKRYGWGEVLKYKTEDELLKNWADILFENNKGIDRLNDYPLTDGEMRQIIEQIERLKTPLRLNGFINGKTVSIIRDNADDKAHFGKAVSLEIYDRKEIAAGHSKYQIAQQPVFKTSNELASDRRGDIMLLINGMPVVHIELKATGIPVSQACFQLEKYANEGVYRGIYRLVQIFVAMNPEETVYFANPGPEGRFNRDFYFHWADFNNEPINNWKEVTKYFLSIPMAHELIGYYTVADDTEGILKVMRSYQYYASVGISSVVKKSKWDGKHQRGGYIWHTTGSGKTMTSFKSAQLIASSHDADKVIFLIDRVELGIQSLKEYRGFAEESEDIQATESTDILISKLKSIDPKDTLIVTSIQKLSRIKDEDGGINQTDLQKIRKKRLVLIVDECHRSTFGEMMSTIRETFPSAMMFGFTGTPIHEENQKKMNTTATVFGDEIHRYSIGDGIRDKNVLGFDPIPVMTFKEKQLREFVALEAAKAKTVDEAMANDAKKEVFFKYMNDVPMAGGFDTMGNRIKGIEDYVQKSQYETLTHRTQVVEDILDNWVVLSRNSKFHAIFATSCIPDAIAYYRLFKSKNATIKITALFDPTIDNNGGAKFKEDGLIELVEDYNKMFNQDFTIPSFDRMKKDIVARLAHKSPYTRIDRQPEEQIDLLIVVDQMLTGFDSKWVNTLYLDKLLENEGLIQAFSRTNRLFGPEKPFGTVKWYRKTYTMKKLIDQAVKLYSGDKPFGIFVDKLPKNIACINALLLEIKDIFESSGISDYSKLPDSIESKQKFALAFKKLNNYVEAAKIQGLTWKSSTYNVEGEAIHLDLDENTYHTLLQRYKELAHSGGQPGGVVPYDLDGYITKLDTERIDSDYLNSKFVKYIKSLANGAKENIKKTEEELHKSFTVLSQVEQKYAKLFLWDIQSGNTNIADNKTFREYIAEYMARAKNNHIHEFAVSLGVNETMLIRFVTTEVTESNINEFGRFDALKATVDKKKAKEYLEKNENKTLSPIMVNIMVDKMLRQFVLSGGKEL